MVPLSATMCHHMGGQVSWKVAVWDSSLMYDSFCACFLIVTGTYLTCMMGDSGHQNESRHNDDGEG